MVKRRRKEGERKEKGRVKEGSEKEWEWKRK